MFKVSCIKSKVGSLISNRYQVMARRGGLSLSPVSYNSQQRKLLSYDESDRENAIEEWEERPTGHENFAM